MGDTPKTMQTSNTVQTFSSRLCLPVPPRCVSLCLTQVPVGGCFLEPPVWLSLHTRTIPEICASNSLQSSATGFTVRKMSGHHLTDFSDPSRASIPSHPIQFHFSLPPTEFYAVSFLAPNVAFRAAKNPEDPPIFALLFEILFCIRLRVVCPVKFLFCLSRALAFILHREKYQTPLALV